MPLACTLSDRTWCFLGRRRPYLLGGALLASLALAFMPYAPNILVATILLWVLDTGLNVCNIFAAFLTDLIPNEQHKTGFAAYGVMIGLGGVLASALPFVLENWFGVAAHDLMGAVPPTVKTAFWIGAVCLAGLMIFTALVTKESPPPPRTVTEAKSDWRKLFKFPLVIKQLMPIQFFSWFGFFLVWVYLGVAVAKHIFHAEPGSLDYAHGIEFGGLCFMVYNFAAFVYSLLLVRLGRRWAARDIHIFSLVAGGLSLILLGWAESAFFSLVAMVGVGMAWASVNSMPLAMLSVVVPDNSRGWFIGINNIFIVLPMVCASFFFGYFVDWFFAENLMLVFVLAGVLMLTASLLCLFVKKHEVVNEAQNKSVSAVDERLCSRRAAAARACDS